MRRAFAGAALGLWLLFLVEAVLSPVLLDDWFQLRFWRDHAFGLASLWEHARYDYVHYNPRIGEVFLAVIDGSRAIHLIVTPLVQLALLPIVFAIAFARWPRATWRDLQVLLFIQVMIWLVVPIPGIMYFYRPYATNYLWTFVITLALFVPYRLAVAPRWWLAPAMLGLGWLAGMCNEHTGPTAMVAIVLFVAAAWRARRLRAWMVAGMVGLYVGYPMLFFAPGQSVRYAGLATRATPVKLLAERGPLGCLAILRDFVVESHLGLLVFAAAVGSYLLSRRAVRPPRAQLITAGVLTAAAAAIVVTLFVSPTASDRVFFASGVLLVAALAVGARHLLEDRDVRRLLVATCAIVLAYHAVRFVETSLSTRADNDDRLARLARARPGSAIVVPRYAYAEHSRWVLGDDFQYFPWLAGYVGGELHDLARVDVEHRDPRLAPQVAPPGPTYRELQAGAARLFPYEVAIGVYDDPRGRPVVVVDGDRFVDGRPEGHAIRVRSIPPHLTSTLVVGCGVIAPVTLIDGDLVPIDERYCRGPFTAIMCEPDRCWVAGWY